MLSPQDCCESRGVFDVVWASGCVCGSFVGAFAAGVVAMRASVASFVCLFAFGVGAAELRGVASSRGAGALTGEYERETQAPLVWLGLHQPAADLSQTYGAALADYSAHRGGASFVARGASKATAGHDTIDVRFEEAPAMPILSREVRVGHW